MTKTGYRGVQEIFFSHGNKGEHMSWAIKFYLCEVLNFINVVVQVCIVYMYSNVIVQVYSLYAK